MGDAPYVLGHSEEELRRLQSQARSINPMTRRFLLEAGLASGMRVLDVGCGAGDVSLLVADLVGSAGEVVGFDRSATAIEAARSKAEAAGKANVSFVNGVAESLSFDRPFDAVVGRYVLQFQRDPTALLRTLRALAAPGAPIVFHELDWSGVTSDPPAETYDRLAGWLTAALEHSGATAHMGLRLPGVFVEAGLGDPQVRLEQRIGIGSSAKEVVDRLIGLARSLAGAMADAGVVTADELGLDSLAERIMTEVTARSSLLRSHLQIAAWSSAPNHSPSS
jgi:SAM-dependent methyltransferase